MLRIATDLGRKLNSFRMLSRLVKAMEDHHIVVSRSCSALVFALCAADDSDMLRTFFNGCNFFI